MSCEKEEVSRPKDPLGAKRLRLQRNKVYSNLLVRRHNYGCHPKSEGFSFVRLKLKVQEKLFHPLNSKPCNSVSLNRKNFVPLCEKK